MAKLKAAARAPLPAAEIGEAKPRKPMQMVSRGKLSPAAAAKIRAKANAILD